MDQTRVCLASIRPPTDAAATLTSVWKRAGGRSSAWKACGGANWTRQLRLYSWPSSVPTASFSFARSAAARPVHPCGAGKVSAHSTCA